MSTGDEGNGPGLPRGRLTRLAALLVFQSGLLVGMAALPDRLPDGLSGLVAVLSVAVAGLVTVDARAVSPDSWWQPTWPLWSAGALVPGLNAGVCLAYGYRRLEVVTEQGPTERWQRPLIVAALAAAVGAALVRAGTVDGTVRGLVALAALNAVGFGLPAAYYDTRFVSSRLDGTGHGWPFDGYHWPVLLLVVIPANVLFVLLYYWRRRTLLARARRSAAGVDRLAHADVPTAEPGGDDSDG
jgi:hypothetical protein